MGNSDAVMVLIILLVTGLYLGIDGNGNVTVQTADGTDNQR